MRFSLPLMNTLEAKPSADSCGNAAITILNDAFRSTLAPSRGSIRFSDMVRQRLPLPKQFELLHAVRDTADFTDGEALHDAGYTLVDGTRYSWRITYDADTQGRINHHGPRTLILAHPDEPRA